MIRNQQPSQSPCQCCEEILEDQISALPDGILSHILSMLLFKEAIATSILSRRWRFLWTLITSLNFGTEEKYFQPMVEQERFINMVNQVLRLYKVSYVHEFTIRSELFHWASCHIDRWVGFAFAKGVSKLELDLGACIYRVKNYSIPPDFFDETKEMKHLQSEFNVFPSSVIGKNHLKPLKELILSRVDISDEIFENVLSACSSLERLFLRNSKKLINAKHSGAHLKLKCLEMFLCPDLENLEIFAPNLVIFTYKGSKVNISIRGAKHLANVSAVSLTFKPDEYPENSYLGLTYPERFYFTFGQFATYLPQLEYLKIDFHCFEGRRLSDEVPHFPKLKHLVFCETSSCLPSLCYRATISLVRASPLLHRLELHIKRSPESDNMMYYYKKRRKRKKNLISPPQNLKEFVLSGFKDDEFVMELIMSIFDYATALEMVEIRTGSMIWIGSNPSYVKGDRVVTAKSALQLSQRLPPNAQLKFVND